MKTPEIDRTEHQARDKRRRDQGTGSLFRANGCKRWTMQFYQNGKRVREATGTENKTRAQQKLTERLDQVNKGEFTVRERRPATVEQLFLLVKADYLANQRPSAECLKRWAHLAPFFATTLAKNVTTDSVIGYTVQRQEERAANATINRELAVLRRAFNLARRSTPPKVKSVPYIPMLKENNVRKGFVEDADFSRLAAEASEPWLRTFLELSYSYGWRKKELLGLRVRQVNLEQRTLRLDAGTTKNDEGREVGMTAKAAELLRLAVARKRSDDFVLTRADGKAVKDFRHAWWNLCVVAGLGSFVCRDCKLTVTTKKCECGSSKREYRGLVIHDLRRSAAKALRRAGVPESVIMDTGGWKTPAMFRRYAIVSSADQRAAVEMLERARAESSRKVALISDETRSESTAKSTEKVQ